MLAVESVVLMVERSAAELVDGSAAKSVGELVGKLVGVMAA